jgi:hypothetical protein
MQRISAVGPLRHFAALRNLVAIGEIADFGQANALEDLWVHGLALLWQIYSRCFSSLIQDRQYGHR